MPNVLKFNEKLYSTMNKSFTRLKSTQISWYEFPCELMELKLKLKSKLIKRSGIVLLNPYSGVSAIYNNSVFNDIHFDPVQL